MVWQFFTKDNEGKPICNECQKSYSKTTATSVLNRHVKAKHSTLQMTQVNARLPQEYLESALVEIGCLIYSS